MATCPRCGATVKEGRSACWKCWAPLPKQLDPEPPPPSVPPDPAPAPLAEEVPDVLQEELPPAAEAIPAPAPFPETAPLPEPEPEPAPDPISEPDPAPPVAHVQSEAAPHVLIPARQPRARAHSGSWILGLLFSLALMGTAALCWKLYFSPAQSSAVEPADVAEHYLQALAVGNTTEQQQLATEASRGDLFPGWLSIDRGRLQGAARAEGSTQSFPVEITLIPGGNIEHSSHKLVTALSRPYRLQLILKQERDGWRVDQQRLLADLKAVLEQENPDVAFPAWK